MSFMYTVLSVLYLHVKCETKELKLKLNSNSIHYPCNNYRPSLL